MTITIHWRVSLILTCLLAATLGVQQYVADRNYVEEQQRIQTMARRTQYCKELDAVTRTPAFLNGQMSEDDQDAVLLGIDQICSQEDWHAFRNVPEHFTFGEHP
jgi:hypothetical protein